MAKVSIIVPAYNRAHLLPESLGSVLSQDHKDIEIVIVDDGSTDDTADVIRGIDGPIVYLRQNNSGASVARNHGILRSTGDYLMFLDSDDILLPSAISRLARALDENEEFGAAYCGFVETRDGEVVRRSPLDRPSGNVFTEMATEYLCIVHSVMVRRECLAQVGLFDAKMRMYEDMEFNVRLAARYNFVFVPEHLAEYRLSHSQASKMTADIAAQRIYYMRRMRGYLRNGLLSRRKWWLVHQRIYGPGIARKALYEASAAYGAGDWARTLRRSAVAALLDPRFMLTKTWLSMTGRSACRALFRRRKP